MFTNTVPRVVSGSRVLGDYFFFLLSPWFVSVTHFCNHKHMSYFV